MNTTIKVSKNTLESMRSVFLKLMIKSPVRFTHTKEWEKVFVLASKADNYGVFTRFTPFLGKDVSVAYRSAVSDCIACSMNRRIFGDRLLLNEVVCDSAPIKDSNMFVFE